MKKYESIINLPRFNPKNHKRMEVKNRAAQFAPFAALTGYEEEIKEKGRLTKNKKEFDEDFKTIIDTKLKLITNIIKKNPLIKVEFYVKDKKKEGGKYTEYIGNLNKIDQVQQKIIFKDGYKINLNNIIDIALINNNC